MNKILFNRRAFLSLAFSPLALTLLFISGCNRNSETPDAGADEQEFFCETSADCGSDQFVCAGGTCVPGECTDREVALRESGSEDPNVLQFGCGACEICNIDFECVIDPTIPLGPPDETGQPTGSECIENVDCGRAGYICARGQCYDTAIREKCTQNQDCDAGEVCDLASLTCINDYGGCIYCDCFPELCCTDTQVCDTAINPRGQCSEVPVAADECVTNDDCGNTLETRGKPYCEAGRCLQCISNDDCFGTTTCSDIGECVSENVIDDDEPECQEDDDCTGFDERCDTTTRLCFVPECESNRDCRDNQTCNEATFSCELNDPICEMDRDEPNESINAAKEITNAGEVTGDYCRGGIDYYRFPVTSGLRYNVIFELSQESESLERNESFSIAILDERGLPLSSQSYTGTSTTQTLSAVARDNDTFFVVRILSTAVSADLWEYELDISSSAADLVADCSETAEGLTEPNGSAASAHMIGMGEDVFSRCSNFDKDFYVVNNPTASAVEVQVNIDGVDGALRISVYDTPDTVNALATTVVNDFEVLTIPEGMRQIYIQLEAASPSSAATEQGYRLKRSLVERAATCDGDVGEDDRTIEIAQNLSTDAMLTRRLCYGQDTDVYRLDVPAETARIIEVGNTESGGRLLARLFNESGVLAKIGLSARETGYFSTPSTSSAQTYYIDIKYDPDLIRASGGDYTINSQSIDTGFCAASEPVSNGELETGTCLGSWTTDVDCADSQATAPNMNVALSTCLEAENTTPGCGTICVDDDDWYRIGRFGNDESIEVIVEYDPSLVPDGFLTVQFGRMNPNGTGVNSSLNITRDTSRSGTITVGTIAPGDDRQQEFGFRVSSDGDGPFINVPYSYSVNIGSSCIADMFEKNDNAATGYSVRGNEVPGSAFNTTLNGTLCSGDIDFFKILNGDGETTVVTYKGPLGTYLEGLIGSELITGTTLNSDNCPFNDVTNEETCLQLEYETTSLDFSEITIGRHLGQTSVGEYVLMVEIMP